MDIETNLEVSYIKNLTKQKNEEIASIKRKIAAVREAAERKQEYYARIQQKAKQMNEERLAKDLKIEKLKNQCMLLDKGEHSHKKIEVEYESALDFVQRTPKDGVQLLISELKEIDEILTTENKEKKAENKLEEAYYYTVEYKDERCVIRTRDSNYTFEDLNRDAAIYFGQNPQDTMLKDTQGAIWPSRARLIDEYDKRFYHIILSLKHGRVAQKKYGESDVNWEEVAVHARLEARLKEMSKWHAMKNRDNTRREKSKSISREIFGFIMYLAFLSCTIYVVFSHVSLISAFQLNNAIKEALFYENFPVACEYENGLQMTYFDIIEPAQFFCWYETLLVNALILTDSSQDRLESAYINPDDIYENRLFLLNYNQLGGIRFQQHRVKQGSCSVYNYKDKVVYEEEDAPCYDRYSEDKRDIQQFGPALPESDYYKDCIGNESYPCIMIKAFQFTEEIPESATIYGKFANYESAGYYIDSSDILDGGTLTIERMQELKDFLEEYLWIDIQTRVVIINFALYNINYDYFTTVSAILEFDSSGMVLPSLSINTIYVSFYKRSWDKMSESAKGFFIKVPEIYCYTYTVVAILFPTITQTFKSPKITLSQTSTLLNYAISILILGICILRATLYSICGQILDNVEKKSFVRYM